MTPNISALKQCDNLKWDFQDSYPKATKLFALSGEVTNEVRSLAQGIVNQMQSIKSEADALIEAAQAIIG